MGGWNHAWDLVNILFSLGGHIVSGYLLFITLVDT